VRQSHVLSIRPYHALAHPDFRRLWLAQFVSQTGSQMQVVAINWHVYLLTHSALALGFVGLTRVLPVIVFSMWGGVLADRADRRRVMFVSQSAMTLVSVALAGLAWARRDSVAALYLLNAVQAAAVAFDNPSRQALVPRLVPPADLPSRPALKSLCGSGSDAPLKKLTFTWSANAPIARLNGALDAHPARPGLATDYRSRSSSLSWPWPCP
jgi:MFS family permease